VSKSIKSPPSRALTRRRTGAAVMDGSPDGAWPTPSDCGGSGSGGTAVLVRDHLGLACANNLLSPSSRRCAGKVELPGGRRILVMS
jgi:hypothetical protein